MRRFFVFLLVCACGAPPQIAKPLLAPPDVFDVLSQIRTEDLLHDVAWLSSDAQRGRGLFTDDARRTADWLVGELERVDLAVTKQPIAGSGGQSNVVAVRKGSQAQGRDDTPVIILCAHYDHLGVVGGKIHPGADDNASGVAVVLSLARLFSRLTPKYTLVFLFTGAEEAGLLGSAAYVTTPSFPLAATRVVINFDMVGRRFFEVAGGRDHAVAVIGFPGDEALGNLFVAAGRDEDMEIVPVAVGTARLFGFEARTDDYWFRDRGVTAVNLSTGMHADYHTPTDTFDRLVPGQILRIARLCARVLLALSDGL